MRGVLMARSLPQPHPGAASGWGAPGHGFFYLGSFTQAHPPFPFIPAGEAGQVFRRASSA